MHVCTKSKQGKREKESLGLMSRSAETVFAEIIPEVFVAQASSRGVSAANPRVD